MKRKFTLTQNTLPTLVEECIKYCNKKNIHIITLHGNLGFGKTTLVQSFGKYFGIKDPITSPTYTLLQTYTIKQHDNFNKLTHIDAYRLNNPQEDDFGITDSLMHTKDLVLIEWPKHIHSLINTYKVLSITITEDDDKTKRTYLIK